MTTQLTLFDVIDGVSTTYDVPDEYILAWCTYHAIMDGYYQRWRIDMGPGNRAIFSKRDGRKICAVYRGALNEFIVQLMPGFDSDSQLYSLFLHMQDKLVHQDDGVGLYACKNNRSVVVWWV